MPKAIQKLHNGKIVTIWRGKSLGMGSLIKKPNTYAAVYSSKLYGKLMEEGYEVQSPVDVYQFPGHYDQPRDCQKEMLAFMLRHRRCYNLSEPRTGKSAPVGWEIDIDHTYNGKKKFLVIAPLTTLLDTWRTELFGICTSIPAFYSTGGGTAKVKKELQLATQRGGSKIFVINTDKFWRVLTEIIQWGPDSVYVDEAADFNNPDARRAAALVELMKDPQRSLRALTGTPFANRPTDAWSLLRLINPETPKFFGKFRTLTMEKDPDSQYKWHPRPEAKQILAELMQPAIRFKTEDVNDMPDHEGFMVNVGMGKKQEQMFKEMRADMITEDRGRVITAQQAGSKLIKLLQIASGVCYDAEGKPLLIGAEPKIKELKSLIRNAPKQTVVFSNFTAVIRYIVENLRGEWRVSTITGGVPTEERQKRIDAFQAGKLDVLVMHPRPTQYGLKLHAASQALWFGPIYSAMQFKQAGSRIRGPGTGKTSYGKISGCELEEQIYAMIEERIANEEETLNISKSIQQIYQSLVLGE